MNGKEVKGCFFRQALTAMAVLAATTIARPAVAQSIDTLSYWITQTAGLAEAYSCTAGDPNSPSTYFRQYLGGPNDCPGLTVYQVAKGEWGTNLWSTETYYADSGFVKIIQEVVSYPSYPPPECVNAGFTRNCDDTRAFRDNASGSKGIPTVPLSFTNGWSYNHRPYTEETWVTGWRVCYSNNKVAAVPGSGTRIEMYQGPTFPGFLQDQRGWQPAMTWNDVQTIERHDFWGTNNEERYWYGRWFNPQTGQWGGVGLVKWQHYEGGILRSSLENHYLVDCRAAVPCWSCPP